MKRRRIIYIFSLIAACAVILCAAASAQNPPDAAGAADTDALTAGTGPDSGAVSGAADKGANWLDDDTEAPPPLTGSDVPGIGSVLARLAGAMLVIVAILGGGLFLIQKISRRKFNLGFDGKNQPLHMVDKLMIGPKTYVCLLRVCGRYLAVGVTEKEMNVLTEVALPDEVENGAAESDFSGTLAKAAGTNKAEASGDE